MAQNADETRAPFRKFNLVLNTGLGIWLSVLVVTWLASDHPWGAFGRGIFAAFFLWSAYRSWKSESAYTRTMGWGMYVFAGLGAVGVAVLWVVAETTGDTEYRHEAIGFSFWGGMLAIPGLFLAAMWVHPKTRARVRAIQRGERQQP